ncbi:hypothetical protein BDN72DRAFT_423567 [Pluteus cervinus]|uniref:Uncharacterized protein n=1 Tax=Pluteus cervinus TaxID=181527 RepID=A0ACD3A8V9_9AGAR|nr:hypothetical protein BDN72DRAFT_423567 [Pluteus cervinus]
MSTTTDFFVYNHTGLTLTQWRINAGPGTVLPHLQTGPFKSELRLGIWSVYEFKLHGHDGTEVDGFQVIVTPSSNVRAQSLRRGLQIRVYRFIACWNIVVYSAGLGFPTVAELGFEPSSATEFAQGEFELSGYDGVTMETLEAKAATTTE